MQDVKTFLKAHKLIVSLLFIWFVIFSILLLIFVKDWLTVLLSPEVLVGIMVGIAAIYSWFHQKGKEENETDLQMLKDIDEIRDHYTNKKDELDIVKKCQKHLTDLRKKHGSSDTFLCTYLDYVESKIRKNPMQDNNDNLTLSNDISIETSDDSKVENLKEIEKKHDSCHYTIQGDGKIHVEQTDNEIKIANSLGQIKEKIAEREKMDKKYIRFSRNYKEVTEDSRFKWSTWYSLPKELIVNSRNVDKFIFFTKVGGYYKGVWILGDNLKKLIDNMTPSTEKSGKQTYDFYICEKLDGSYYESRYDNELSHYEVEPLELDYLN